MAFAALSHTLNPLTPCAFSSSAERDAPQCRFLVAKRFASNSTPLSLSFSARTPLSPSPLPLSLLRAQALDQEAPAAEESSPAEGSKIYVGNLPWNVDSASLAEIFQDAGVVEEVEVVCDRDTGRSRGFAFVVMQSPEEAQAAIERFDGSDLGGRLLKVNYPAPPGQRRTPSARPAQRRFDGGMGGRRERDDTPNPNKLYVGNLSWGVDDRALQELFGEYGRVVEAKVVMDRETGRSKGFGFVTLSNQGEASQAVSNLDGAEFDGRQLRVNPAGQRP